MSAINQYKIDKIYSRDHSPEKKKLRLIAKKKQTKSLLGNQDQIESINMQINELGVDEMVENNDQEII